jgi:hypothetical protein
LLLEETGVLDYVLEEVAKASLIYAEAPGAAVCHLQLEFGAIVTLSKIEEI